MSIPARDPNFTMAELQKVGEDFLEAGQRFWEASHKAGISGAVIWLKSEGGEMVIFTRGEYRETLLRNIEFLGPTRMFGAAKDE